jgi:hypothetical protein
VHYFVDAALASTAQPIRADAAQVGDDDVSDGGHFTPGIGLSYFIFPVTRIHAKSRWVTPSHRKSTDRPDSW